MKIAPTLSLIICVILAASLAGCKTTGKMLSSAASASLASGILGGEFGNALDKKSMEKALHAEYTALERGRSGVPHAWTGEPGVAGKVVPQQPYQVGSANCRRYEHILLNRNVEKRATGTACRDEAGVWVPLK